MNLTHYWAGRSVTTSTNRAAPGVLETPPRALLDTFPSLDSSKGRTVIDHSRAIVARAEQPLTFTFAETGDTIQAIAVDGEPWFIAAPIARFLSYRDADKLLRNLDGDEKGTHSVGTPGDQRVSIISLPGLLRALTVRRAGAVKDEEIQGRLTRFQRWVFHEVLPQAVAAPVHELPKTFADALELAARQAREIEASNTRIAELEPSAGAWDALASTGRDYSAREAAYILNRDPGITTGQNLLLGKIRQLRMVDPFDRPYADHKSHLTLRPQSYTDSEGTLQDAKPQLRITYAGLRYLHKKLGGTAQLRLEAGEGR